MQSKSTLICSLVYLHQNSDGITSIGEIAGVQGTCTAPQMQLRYAGLVSSRDLASHKGHKGHKRDLRVPPGHVCLQTGANEGSTIKLRRTTTVHTYPRVKVMPGKFLLES